MPRAAMATSEGFMARTFAFNVTAPLTLTKLADGARWWTPSARVCVNISSRSASMTQTMFVAYGTAKAALDRMTRNIAPRAVPAGAGQRHRRRRRRHTLARRCPHR